MTFLSHFSMAAIEENSLQPSLPPTISEEDRALLLHTHQTWKRSRRSGEKETSQPEKDRSGTYSLSGSYDFFRLTAGEAIFATRVFRMQISKIYLPGEIFEEADLRVANFQGANLRGVRFMAAQLARANFSQADLIWANFQHADLQGSDIQNASLRGATFVRTQIRSGNFFPPIAPGLAPGSGFD